MSPKAKVSIYNLILSHLKSFELGLSQSVSRRQASYCDGYLHLLGGVVTFIDISICRPVSQLDLG